MNIDTLEIGTMFEFFTINIAGTLIDVRVDDEICDWFNSVRNILDVSENISGNGNIIFVDVCKWKDVYPPATVRQSKSSEWRLFKHGSLYRIWLNFNELNFCLELNRDIASEPDVKYIPLAVLMKQIYRIFLNAGGTLIHSASAMLRDAGILFAGAGGQGKSTCYHRLPAHWLKICDDTTLIAKKGCKYYLYSTPTVSSLVWGTKRNSFAVKQRDEVQLKKVFFIKQSKRFDFVELNKRDSFIQLQSSIKQSWANYMMSLGTKERKKVNSLIINNALSLVADISCYYMYVGLDDEFWFKIEDLINGS